jgi:hypothetical protein
MELKKKSKVSEVPRSTLKDKVQSETSIEKLINRETDKYLTWSETSLAL